MNNTLIKAIRSTLDTWSTLDDSHKGNQHEVSKTNLEIWLNELEANALKKV